MRGGIVACDDGAAEAAAGGNADGAAAAAEAAADESGAADAGALAPMLSEGVCASATHGASRAAAAIAGLRILFNVRIFGLSRFG